jgi:hypothetical protein
MKVVNGLGYLEEQNTADTEAGSLYFRTKYDLGRTPIEIDVENDHDLSLNYRITVNGWTSSWITLSSGQRLQSAFTLPSVIGAGENVKFTIEADEGTHSWGYSDGVIFHSIRLVDAGISVDLRDERQQTALMLAAWAGRAESVTTLLELGADPHAKDADGVTAMDKAQEKGHTRIAELLSAL